jgi:hypothetical protein
VAPGYRLARETQLPMRVLKIILYNSVTTDVKASGMMDILSIGKPLKISRISLTVDLIIR